MIGATIPCIAQKAYQATDFSEYAVGTQITTVDWTEFLLNGSLEKVIQSQASLSGRILYVDKNGSDGRANLFWNRIPGSYTDGELLGRIMPAEEPSNDEQVGFLLARRSSTDNAEYYSGDLEKSSGGTKRFGIWRESGSGDTYLAQTNFAWDVLTTWWWVRLRIVGNALKAKIWASGSAEPTSWTLEATDNTHATGLWGLLTEEISASYRVDWFSFCPGSTPSAPGPSG